MANLHRPDNIAREAFVTQRRLSKGDGDAKFAASGHPRGKSGGGLANYSNLEPAD